MECLCLQSRSPVFFSDTHCSAAIPMSSPQLRCDVCVSWKVFYDLIWRQELERRDDVSSRRPVMRYLSELAHAYL